MSATIDVGKFIDERKVSRFQIQAFLLCWLAMLIDGFDAQSIGYVAPVIAKQWGVATPAFGPVFSAGLLGLAIGGLVFGMLADRFGRKTIIVVCLGFAGVFTLAKVSATSVTMLLILQFVASLGVGGIVPNALALTSEYAPKHLRALMVATVSVAFAVGASAAGLVAAGLFARYGWQSMFYVGGIVALVVIPWLMASLPESIRFLMFYRGQNWRVERILKKIDPALQLGAETQLVTSERKIAGAPVVLLLTHGRAPTTLLLWFAMFMDFVVLKFLVSWLPVLLHGEGYSVENASVITSTYLIGGIVGAPVVGRLMDRFGLFRMLALAFALGAVFIGITSFVGSGSFGLMCLVFFAVGCFAIGGHNGLDALASVLYPTYARSTGLGWALGMGHFGSTLSPLLGSLFLAWHWGFSAILPTIAIPAILAAGTVLLIKAVRVPPDAGAED